MDFKIAQHSITGRHMVQVTDNDGCLVAGIYLDDKAGGISVISKYIVAVQYDDDKDNRHPLPALTMRFKWRELTPPKE